MTRDQTEKVKAFAVLVIFWYHLFGCGSYLTLPENVWIPIISEKLALDLCAGPICLHVFIFCSGYGLYRSYICRNTDSRDFIRRFTKILIPYWTVLALTVLYLALRGKFNPEHLFVNLFALVHDDDMLYATFSWFVKLYLELPFVLLIVQRIEKRGNHTFWKDFLGYVLMPVGIWTALYPLMLSVRDNARLLFLVVSLQELFFYLPDFFTAMLCAKYGVFEKLREKTAGIPSALLLPISVVLLLFILVIQARNMISQRILLDWAQAFLIVCCLLCIMERGKFHSRHILPFIGKNSLYYWLLSGLFFLNTSVLQFIIYAPRYTVLILIWQVIVETPLVLAVKYVSGKLLNLIDGLIPLKKGGCAIQ